MSRFNLSIPDDVRDRLAIRAAAEHRTITSAIVWAVELWLATPPQLPATPAPTTTEQDDPS